jgi:hypothetical protein
MPITAPRPSNNGDPESPWQIEGDTKKDCSSLSRIVTSALSTHPAPEHPLLLARTENTFCPGAIRASEAVITAIRPG